MEGRRDGGREERRKAGREGRTTGREGSEKVKGGREDRMGEERVRQKCVGHTTMTSLVHHFIIICYYLF